MWEWEALLTLNRINQLILVDKPAYTSLHKMPSITLPAQCVTPLSQWSTRSNCCWMIKSSEILCLSWKSWDSPTDLLRHLTPLCPSFLYKNLPGQSDSNGKGQAQHGEHLTSIKIHPFWLSHYSHVYRMVQSSTLCQVPS